MEHTALNKKSILSYAFDESDVLLTFGTIAVFFGVLQAYPPAAYSVVGVFVIYLAFLQAKAEASKMAEFRQGSIV